MTIYDDSLFMPASSAASTQRISFDDDILEHCQWVLEHIYQKPYLDGKARHCHGILHVSRAAMFGVMWANVRRRQGDREALGLTERELKLIQIALLFHDSARENDNADLWDNESAINLYKYLTITLGVDHNEAKKIAEATANKDHDVTKPYQKLVVENGEVKFRPAATTTAQKNIFQKIIHDSDCLDIMRCNPLFDARFLDFYQDYCKSDTSSEADIILMEIITEARALMTFQGDYWKFQNEDKKSRYQVSEGYSRIVKDAKRSEIGVSLLHELVVGNQLIDPQTLQMMPWFQIPPRAEVGDVLTFENVVSLIKRVRQGPPYLIFRGVGSPSAKPKNSTKDTTMVDLEIRKTRRAQGNPARSTSMQPSEIYTRAGFLVVLDKEFFSDVHQVSSYDFDSGRYKKTKSAASNLTSQEAAKTLARLSREITLEPAKDTNESRYARDIWRVAHNETLLTIKESMIKGIGYSRDYSIFSNDILQAGAIPLHPDVGLLEAYFIQQAYQRQTRIVLPIFEVSYYSNQYRQENIDLKRLIEAWRNVCRAYISDQLNKGYCQDLMNMEIEQLKINAIYGGQFNNLLAICNQSVDMYYTPQQKKLVEQIIIVIRDEEISAHQERLVKFIREYQETQSAIEYFCTQSSMDRYEFFKELLMLKISNEEIRGKRDRLLKKFKEQKELTSSMPAEIIHRFRMQYEPERAKQSCQSKKRQLNGNIDALLKTSSEQALATFIEYQCLSALENIQKIFKEFSFIDEGVLTEEKCLPELQRKVFNAIKRCAIDAMREYGTMNDENHERLGWFCPCSHFYDAITFLLNLCAPLGEDEIALKDELRKHFLSMLDSLANNTTELKYVSIFYFGNAEQFIKIIDELDIDASNLPARFLAKQLPANDSQREAFGPEILSRVRRHAQFVQVLLKNDTNDEQFKRFIEAFFYDARNDRYYQMHPIQYIYDDLLILRKSMPNKTFSKEQLDYINPRLFQYAERMKGFHLMSIRQEEISQFLYPLIRAFIEFGSPPQVPDILRRLFFVSTMCHLEINLWDEDNYVTRKYVKIFNHIGLDIDRLKKRVKRSLIMNSDLKDDQEFVSHFLLAQGEFRFPLNDDGYQENKNNSEVLSILKQSCESQIDVKEIEKSALIAALTSSDGKEITEEWFPELILQIKNRYGFPEDLLEKISACITIDEGLKKELISQYVEVWYAKRGEFPEILFFGALFQILQQQQREVDIQRLIESQSVMPQTITFDFNCYIESPFQYLLQLIPKNLKLKFVNKYRAEIKQFWQFEDIFRLLPFDQQFGFAKDFDKMICDMERLEIILQLLPNNQRFDFAKGFRKVIIQYNPRREPNDIIGMLPSDKQKEFRAWLLEQEKQGNAAASGQSCFEMWKTTAADGGDQAGAADTHSCQSNGLCR